MIVNVNNKDEFQDYINREELTIVKFSAEWCGPCQKMSEIIDEIKDKYPNVLFLEVDIENIDDSLLTEYSVRNIPLILFFKNGLIIDRTIGVMLKDKFAEKIEENLKK